MQASREQLPARPADWRLRLGARGALPKPGHAYACATPFTPTIHIVQHDSVVATFSFFTVFFFPERSPLGKSHLSQFVGASDYIEAGARPVSAVLGEALLDAGVLENRLLCFCKLARSLDRPRLVSP